MKIEYQYQLIRSAHFTEKTSTLGELKQLVFKVDRNATKSDIKEALEALINVTVTDVRTVNVKGKKKRFGGRSGTRSNYKKAYVSLDKSVDMEALLSQQNS